jgi:excisionase family DNA binding protein
MPADAVDGPRLLTIAQAARYLNVSRAQMFRIAKAREVPVLKIGRLSRVRPEALEEYIGRLDTLSRSPGSPTLTRVA